MWLWVLCALRKMRVMPDFQPYWTHLIRGDRQTKTKCLSQNDMVKHNLQKLLQDRSLLRSTRTILGLGIPGHLMTNGLKDS